MAYGMDKERIAYLNELADEYGVKRSRVYALAMTLGEEEDRDGLVSELEDLVAWENE